MVMTSYLKNSKRRSKINAGSSAEETSSLVSGGTAGGASNVAVSGSAVGSGAAVGEKRTRFSLSHDEGSIGNTSDNLEAISEAASNHSLASR